MANVFPKMTIVEDDYVVKRGVMSSKLILMNNKPQDAFISLELITLVRYNTMEDMLRDNKKEKKANELSLEASES